MSLGCNHTCAWSFPPVIWSPETGVSARYEQALYSVNFKNWLLYCVVKEDSWSHSWSDLSPLLCVLQGLAPRTPGGSKPPHPRLQGCNKENEAQLKGTPVSGALLTSASPQRNFSIASVASTYSEFVVIYSFVSNFFALHLFLHFSAVTLFSALQTFQMMYKY